MKKRRERKRWVVFSVIVAAFLLCGLICNTISLRKTLNQVIGQYVTENNRQLAAHISYRIKSGRMFAEEFADTLERMPGFLLTDELLERKADAMELEEIVVADRENKVLAASGEAFDLSVWMDEHPEIWKESVVSYVKDKGILFSAPVIKKGIAEKVVIGIQNYRDIQSLVNGEEHQENGACMLLDQENGEMIMMENGIRFSMKQSQIDSLLDKVAEKDYQKIVSVEDYVISANLVSGTGWVQITIMPWNAMMQEIAIYVDKYFLLILVSLVLFGVILHQIRKTSRKRELFFLTDPLTGGYNREGFLKLSSDYVDEKNADSYVVLCLNVSNFRQINELWGEDAGNKTLLFLYHELSRNMKEKEIVSRSSMDHFLLLLKEKTDQEVSERVQVMIAGMNETIRKKYFGYTIRFTVGSCRVSVAGSVAFAINHATYAGKQSREKNKCNFYNEEVAKKIAMENQLDELFEDSLKHHHFQVYLQPKVSTREGQPCQAEALVRWIHPEKGMIYPDQFIPLFEKNGKICQLDLYMFEEVCRLVAQWIAQKKTVTKISVNVSRFHLRNTGAEVWKKYREIKERYEIPDGILELELTETILIDVNQIDFIKEIFKGFHSSGLDVALDDFGFAYSSLALLKEFEVDTLKMDRSFFTNESGKSRKVVENVIQLAHSLDMSVVAEGIEEEEQVAALGAMGCDFIQGYVYSRPIPAETFETWREETGKNGKISGNL